MSAFAVVRASESVRNPEDVQMHKSSKSEMGTAEKCEKEATSEGVRLERDI